MAGEGDGRAAAYAELRAAGEGVADAQALVALLLATGDRAGLPEAMAGLRAAGARLAAAHAALPPPLRFEGEGGV